MFLGIPRETMSGETRVAIAPDTISTLHSMGLTVLVERGAGEAAGFPDDLLIQQGAMIASRREELFEACDIIAQVNTYAANAAASRAELMALRANQIIIGLADPLSASERVAAMAERGVIAFGLELIPRITRAQSMDVLSSMALIAGYKAVLVAAEKLSRCMPLLMTAAGTLKPARILVIGAGVAGLQAIATARRMGAVVHAYDVRPEVAEQVLSVGGRFVHLDLPTTNAGDTSGYARPREEVFYARQRELLSAEVAASDIVIATAAIPGKRAPLLITRDMVERMRPGSIIMDLAAERGGNCELTRMGREISHGGVCILGPVRLPASVPQHASQLYARNMAAFLRHIIKGNKPNLNLEDEIIASTLMCWGGEIVNQRVRSCLGLGQGREAIAC